MAQFSTSRNNLLKNNNDTYEVVMVSGQAGPSIYVPKGNLNASTDAFGRLRISSPFTLFDSTHRFNDNGLFFTDLTGTANATHNANQGLVDLVIGSNSGDQVLRETKKVFGYQPGKSLLIMNSFTMATPKENLRQRTGYFGSENGFFVEVDGTDTYLVKRSSVTGSTVDTRLIQGSWNVDNLDGTGPSGLTLDISKSQIMWCDIEWLGVGSIRMGFVINGQFILCNVFHHANSIEGTYSTTASLPLRTEITNTGNTSGASTYKEICSTVISEGGYILAGIQRAVNTPITSRYDMATAGNYYPVVSLRLKTDKLDAIVIPSAASILGDGNGINYHYKMVAGGRVEGGTWVVDDSDGAVEYNITGVNFHESDGSGNTIGRTLVGGFFNSSNQGSPTVDILKQALFKFQLQRNSFTDSAETFTFAVAPDTSGYGVWGSLDWDEVTR